LSISASITVGQAIAQAVRRERQQFQLLRLDIAGDVIEQLRRIAARARIGGEEAQIGIDARGDRVIIARAEMAVGAELLALAPHDHRDLGVRLPVDEAVDHLDAGALQRFGPVDILLLVEARLQVRRRR
jgi:hypothetical protein